MGLSWSCPFAVHCDLENEFESVVTNSINLGDDNDNKNKQVRLSSFKSTDSEPTALQFFERKTQTELLPESSSLMGKIPHSSILNPSSPKHEAAIKLQKVYKSFRTRRKLADCAVLIEQSWWKLLDFAELKRSSISFFDIEKHETAISRWSRARTRAAKVDFDQAIFSCIYETVFNSVCDLITLCFAGGKRFIKEQQGSKTRFTTLARSCKYICYYSLDINEEQMVTYSI